jgi:hypothetical protein
MKLKILELLKAHYDAKFGTASEEVQPVVTDTLSDTLSDTELLDWMQAYTSEVTTQVFRKINTIRIDSDTYLTKENQVDLRMLINEAIKAQKKLKKSRGY